jgi:hypothetical protein
VHVQRGQAFPRGLDKVGVDVDARHVLVAEPPRKERRTVAGTGADVENVDAVADHGVPVRGDDEARRGARRRGASLGPVLLRGAVGMQRSDLGDEGCVPVDAAEPVFDGHGRAVAELPATVAVSRPPAGHEFVPGHGGDYGPPP